MENLNRYQLDYLSPGDYYYLDRTFTIVSMPAGLNGQLGIKTKNDDKHIQEPAWITFDLNVEADVYVVYDKRGTPAEGGTLPQWISWQFTDSGLSVEVSDSGASPMRCYRRRYSPGLVSLGSNNSPPASGHDSNYFVIIVPTGN